MKHNGFFLRAALLIVLQILIWDFLDLSQYVMITILPVIILFLPMSVKTPGAMLFAYAVGFIVDFLSSGMLGLSSLALVPVALLRLPFVRLFFGEEALLRKEDLSIKRYGWGSSIVCILLLTAIFLAAYIWADGAGTRPLAMNLEKLGFSLAGSFVVSLPMASFLCTQDKAR